jgi:hypothetical protein
MYMIENHYFADYFHAYKFNYSFCCYVDLGCFIMLQLLVLLGKYVIISHIDNLELEFEILQTS